MQNIYKSITNNLKDVFRLFDQHAENILFDLTKNIEFGDIYTNASLLISSNTKLDKSKINEAIEKNLKNNSFISEIKFEKNGFVNIKYSDTAYTTYYKEVLEKREKIGTGEEVGWKYVEIISANPTGYLHIGHTRNGIFSDTLCNILEYCGYSVRREYLINDYGNQIKELIESIWFKWIAKRNENTVGISDKKPKYSGEDINDCFKYLWNKNSRDWFLEEKDIESAHIYKRFTEDTISWFLEKIKKELNKYQIQVDHWVKESSWVNIDNINKVIRELNPYIKTKDGAIWFNYKGDWEVLIKNDSTHTYFLQDIIYHKQKFKLIGKKDEIINVLGSDHYGHIDKLNNYLDATQINKDIVKFICLQLVQLSIDGKAEKMSKRNSTAIFMKDLEKYMTYEEVRWFFISKAANSKLLIDIEKLKAKDYNNPVYYVMYAYARSKKILSKAEDTYSKEFEFKGSELNQKEREIMNTLMHYPFLIKDISSTLSPHKLPQYLFKLAQLFHSYYEDTNILSEKNNTQKLCILNALNLTIKSGLSLMRIKAKDEL